MTHVASIQLKLLIIREMRSPTAPLTVVASVDRREHNCELLFPSRSNQLISFFEMSAMFASQLVEENCQTEVAERHCKSEFEEKFSKLTLKR